MVEPSSSELISEYIQLILFFGVLAILINWVAWKRGYYRLENALGIEDKGVSLFQVLCVFGIYVGTLILLTPILARFIVRGTSFEVSPNTQMVAMGWLQLVTFLAAALFLFFYARSQNREAMKRIWKDPSVSKNSALADFGLGAVCWIVSFPVVITVGQMADLFLYYFFGIINYEQVAVRYLKLMMTTPSMLGIALFMSLIAAPVIEEFLFRGFLQTWFRRHLGTKAAILLASLCFALFHFSPSQGLGNISLLISLFVFSWFLGFIYAKQGSLFASIGLHITFNAVSVVRILFLPET